MNQCGAFISFRGQFKSKSLQKGKPPLSKNAISEIVYTTGVHMRTSQCSKMSKDVSLIFSEYNLCLVYIICYWSCFDLFKGRLTNDT